MTTTAAHPPCRTVPSVGKIGVANCPTRWPEIASIFEQARPRAFSPGSTLLLHGDSADDFFQIVSGTVRCCTITEDGRRCIFRFVRAGEFLGFMDFERWHFTAEAVDSVVVRSLRRETIERNFVVNSRFHHEVRRLISGEFAAREQQLVMLSHARADERLYWFLREFEDGSESDGYSNLPMSRQDIGDHLGMTFETVSRVFTALKLRGLIEMRGSNDYRVVLRDHRIAA